MEKVVKKTCYYCHLDKDKSKMQELGVWVCNDCLEKPTATTKKKK